MHRILFVILLIKKRQKLKQNDVFNVCSNNPIKTKKIIELLNLYYPTKLRYLGANKIEMLKTHGDNKKIKKISSFKKFSNFDNNIEGCILWFKKNYKLFL